MGKAKPTQHLADRALMQLDVEAALDDRLQIHPPPTYDTVPLWVRSLLHDRSQLRHLLGCQPRLRPGVGPIVQTGQALCIVAVHPVAQGLSLHTGMTCCLFARVSLQHQRQSEHPPRRCAIPAALGLLSQIAGTQLQPCDRHGHRPPPSTRLYRHIQRRRAAIGFRTAIGQ
jgi:hypothetical protein